MDNRKVMVNEVSEGMRLYDDVYSPNGTLLIPKNTVITSNHILKLNLYQVEFIYVYSEVSEPIEIEENLMIPISETEDFIDFSKEYYKHVSYVQEEFASIIRQGNVDTNNLYKLVDNILFNSNKGQNLLSYMCRLKSSDDVTYNHCLNVSILASIFGKWLHLNDYQIHNLTLAGMLHDIGKTQIDESILKKTSKLTDDEYKAIQKHTTLGYNLISKTNLDIGIKQAVLMHHEKMNGDGYPLGLDWNNIHSYAKIVSIVDIYDAMTSDRPYHKRYHPFKVIKMFEEECYGLLDTEFLYVFLEHIAHNFLGDSVELSNGEIGKIIFINKQSPSRPIIQTNNKMIDLFKDSSTTIKNFL